VLLAALTDWEQAFRRLERVYVYASAVSDQDTRVARNQQMQQQAAQVYSELQTATAYMRPEILAIGRPTIERFIAEEPRLAQYRMFLDDILRAAPHTLTPPEEKILARAGLLAQAGGAVHSVFTNADLPYPEVTLSTGEKVRLDASAYGKYRASPVKADRDAVFAAFWGRYGEFTRTLATTLNAHVESHAFSKDVRKFGSSLEAALFDYNIPVSVYQRLIDDVHANLPTLHRYLRLRQKIMGLPSLGYEDLYAPIVERVQLDYTPEQAMALTLDAFAPLGEEYVPCCARATRRAGWTSCRPLASAPAPTAPPCTTHSRSSCSTSTVPGRTCRRWPTSQAIRCTRTWRRSTSRTRRRTTRSSSPRWPPR
jgi:oligoendopeptidase F